jgi:hypothetical protein
VDQIKTKALGAWSTQQTKLMTKLARRKRSSAKMPLPVARSSSSSKEKKKK